MWCRPVVAWGLALALAPALARGQERGGQGGPWGLSLNLNGNLGDNVRFRGTPGLDRGWILSSGGGIGLSRSLRIGRLSLGSSASGSGSLYRENSSLNAVAYAGSLTGSCQLARRAQLTFSDALTRRDTIGDEDLEDEGLLLPRSQLLRNRARADLNVGIGRRLGFSLAARHDVRRYDAPELVDASTFSGNSSLSVGIGRRDNVSISYGLGRGYRQAGNSLSHSLGAGWGHTFNQELQASVGIGLTRLFFGDRSSLPLNGSAQLTYSGGANSLRAKYNRRVKLASALGRESLVQTWTLDYDRPLARWLGISAGLNYSRNQDPFDPAFRLDVLGLSGGLSFRLARRLGMGANYGFFRRALINNPAVNGQRVGLSLAYHFAWGR